MISFDSLVNDFQKIGLQKGDLVNIKASLKSIGAIDNGAETLLDALLHVVGTEGTIVVESFVKSYPLYKLKKIDKYISDQSSPSYAGALANEIISRNNALRSTHPLQKYAAIGKLAECLVNNHNESSGPYDLLKEMIELNGRNLRIGPLSKVTGVGTTHVAIDDVKFAQKRIPLGIYYKSNSQIKRFEVNWPSGCAKAFNNLMKYYDTAVIGKGYVGNAESLLTDMAKTYNIEMELFNKNPELVFCDNPGCPKCQLAWKHSKGSFFKTLFYNIKKADKKRVAQTFVYYFNNNYQPKH